MPRRRERGAMPCDRASGRPRAPDSHFGTDPDSGPRISCARDPPARSACTRPRSLCQETRGIAPGTPRAPPQGMKIICAVDFSEPSLQAARIGARLARRFGDELVLVHAWTSPLLYYREVISDPMRVEEKLVHRSGAELAALARSLGDQGVSGEEERVTHADP